MKSKANYHRHLFKVSKVLETVLHYELLLGGTHGLLTETIKFSKDRGYSHASGILYWLHVREEKKWSRQLTGLRPITDAIFYGDIKIGGKKSLLIFQFNYDNRSLIIDVFRGFYPAHKGILGKILKNHPYLF